MKKRNLHSMLIKNYVIFVIIMLGVALLSLFFLILSLSGTMSDEAFPLLTADMVAIPDYEQIDVTDIVSIGGWVEVLDEDNNVIYVKGDKKTDEYSYSSRYIYEILSYPGSDFGWFCTASNFTAGDGNEYTCLVFLPQDKMDLNLNIINAPFPITNKFITILSISVVLFLILFALNIVLFSKFTASKISKPLNSITASIRDLRSGKMNTRMDFKAENEFLQIRDAFNEMADKLESAQKEKVRMEEARSRMLIDISHDLKTPMTVIGGYSKALAENMVRDADKKRRYIETIYNKSMHVSNMIDELFDLTKLDFKESDLDTKNVDMAEFLRDMVAGHYEQIEDKGLVLDLDIPDEEVMLRINRKEMSRAFSNILVNAVRHNPSGTTIHVKLLELADRIDIVIADNGLGIPENIRDSLFDPFVRGDASRSSSGGTGLGLAIAKKIVEKQAGTLELAYGKDGSYITSFRITFKR